MRRKVKVGVRLVRLVGLVILLRKIYDIRLTQ